MPAPPHRGPGAIAATLARASGNPVADIDGEAVEAQATSVALRASDDEPTFAPTPATPLTPSAPAYASALPSTQIVLSTPISKDMLDTLAIIDAVMQQFRTDHVRHFNSFTDVNERTSLFDTRLEALLHAD